jgi:hypothetical protein
MRFRRNVSSCHDVISQNTRLLITVSYKILHISDLKFISLVSLTSLNVSLLGNTGFCQYLSIMIYLLTAIELTSGSSITVHIYTATIYRATQ